MVIGLGLTLAGAAGSGATVADAGPSVNRLGDGARPSSSSGLGMGACFSSIFDVALGDVAPAEAGSASGSLSAVQQLAAAIGSAVVTTVFFSQRAGTARGHAMTVSLAVVGGIAAVVPRAGLADAEISTSRAALTSAELGPDPQQPHRPPAGEPLER